MDAGRFSEEGAARPSSGQPLFRSSGPSGHRSRMRERVLGRGARSLADYELLEMLLFFVMPRGDTKPLAKTLLNVFGSFEAVLAAPEELLVRAGLEPGGGAVMRLAEEAAACLSGPDPRMRRQLSDWPALMAYIDGTEAAGQPGQLRALYLDNRNRLIADEAVVVSVQGAGPGVAAAAVMRRALVLHATALITLRFCPSGGGGIQQQALTDTVMVKDLRRSGGLLSVVLHDHLVIDRDERISLRQRGMI
ncbi:DNA repair protein RadC [Acetobacter sp. AN02]|uniref:JAB domain-containing protein n=1 Tax=Acetobacter sp. AN02 TaxID=2894186 RepID=UPI0024342C2B|nr:JAB domain-containing protein [Acetobacter sp. AN02]MDG6094194.1 DNA repair protein RadC [Acetobacter sp. AN02]